MNCDWLGCLGCYARMKIRRAQTYCIKYKNCWQQKEMKQNSVYFDFVPHPALKLKNYNYFFFLIFFRFFFESLTSMVIIFFLIVYIMKVKIDSIDWRFVFFEPFYLLTINGKQFLNCLCVCGEVSQWYYKWTRLMLIFDCHVLTTILLLFIRKLFTIQWRLVSMFFFRFVLFCLFVCLWCL